MSIVPPAPFTFTNRHALHPGIWDPFSPFWWVYLSHRWGFYYCGNQGCPKLSPTNVSVDVSLTISVQSVY